MVPQGDATGEEAMLHDVSSRIWVYEFDVGSPVRDVGVGWGQVIMRDINIPVYNIVHNYGFRPLPTFLEASPTQHTEHG